MAKQRADGEWTHDGGDRETAPTGPPPPLSPLFPIPSLRRCLHDPATIPRRFLFGSSPPGHSGFYSVGSPPSSPRGCFGPSGTTFGLDWPPWSPPQRCSCDKWTQTAHQQASAEPTDRVAPLALAAPPRPARPRPEMARGSAAIPDVVPLREHSPLQQDQNLYVFVARQLQVIADEITAEYFQRREEHHIQQLRHNLRLWRLIINWVLGFFIRF